MNEGTLILPQSVKDVVLVADNCYHFWVRKFRESDKTSSLCTGMQACQHTASSKASPLATEFLKFTVH